MYGDINNNLIGEHFWVEYTSDALLHTLTMMVTLSFYTIIQL